MLMDAAKTGCFIAKKRRERNISQRELAEFLHITDKAISKWERGLSFPDITVLIPLSEVLGVSLYDLLTGGGSDE
jgi:transcriptional regulator with XRE-family HTH domain